MRKKERLEGWVQLHVPSNRWAHGHTTHVIYPTALDCKIAECPNDAFRPVKVIVTLAPQERKGR